MSVQHLEENKGLFRRQDQIACEYLNGLFRNFKDERPKVYYDLDGIDMTIGGKPHPCVPEIYVFDSKNNWIYLAWFDNGKIFNKQTYEWTEKLDGLSWCYVSDLFPDTELLHNVWNRNGKKLVYSEDDHKKMIESIDESIKYLNSLKDIFNNNDKSKSYFR